MSIGGTLAQARRKTGLSVSQVSERTRIREAIIRDIERDDYTSCGGDFYARGNIRSIAQVVGADPAALIGEYDETMREPAEITAAEALRPSMPIKAVDRRGPNWAATLAVALLAAVGLLVYHIVSSSHDAPPAAAGPGPAHQPAAGTAAHPTPTLSATPASAIVALTPVKAVAFGPGGAGDGDNPKLAALAIAGSSAKPWYTDFYQTARFGNLQAGTGLLLDMGRPMTITSVRITLGSTPGADIELRAGGSPALADLKTVARATDARGVLRLQPAQSVRGRYLLIWFTRLPKDSSGTYRADVSDVRVKGQT